MVQRVRAVLILAALVFLLGPAVALAQTGSIAGTVRDSQGGVLPGVTVEVSSPQLIEKVRSTTTDGNGRYQIVSLPVGAYKVTFKLERFSTVERSNINLTSDFTAPVNADMRLGPTSEIVTVEAAPAPLVDVKTPLQRQVFSAEELRDLPTTRDVFSLINLVPGIAISTADPFFGTSIPQICSGGGGNVQVNPFGQAYTTTGGQSGCNPLVSSFNAHSSMNAADGSLQQGRIQVDGMNVMTPQTGLTYSTGAYLADVQNAQEVTFTLAGSLGESETGGTNINIVPRTGGNRYAGNYYWSYADQKFYDRNEGTRTRGTSFNFTNQLDHDFDNNGSFGGPILKDRLWFQAGARWRGRTTNLPGTYYNKNEGVFGALFDPDRNHEVQSNEIYRNANLRLTYQATQKNKFNIYWDEQYTCTNPCSGTTNFFTSPEAQASSVTYPLHLAQLSWTNPLTNKILLEAGGSWNAQHLDNTRNRFLPNYQDLPKVTQNGTTSYAGSTVTTGSINNGTYQDNDNIQTRASIGYVTGSHNAKFGYQGQWGRIDSRPEYNDLRLAYAYNTPAAASTFNGAPFAAGCTAGLTPPAGAIQTPAANGVSWCGLLAPGVVNPATSPDSLSSTVFGTTSQTCLNASSDVVCRWPIPTGVTQYIPTRANDSILSNSFYAQDQWTLNKFTLNGALRYDQATSHYGEVCIGPDLFMQNGGYCLNSPDAGPGKNGEGVNFQDITPRWGVAWDVFGNGKTSVKWNMGKYVQGAQIGGVYIAGDPARGGRTINEYTRRWLDLDGDRIVDCDLSIPVTAPTGISFPSNGECFENTSTVNTARRFGRSPDELDADGQVIGLGTVQCGRNDSSRIPQAIQDYCRGYFANGGSDLLHGWNKRQYEWQFSLGVQHELLPRMSIEVTYNRRETYNSTISDTVGVGCDLYRAPELGPIDANQCMALLRDYQSTEYDFFAVRVPESPALPKGGGYTIPGLIDRKTGVTLPTSSTIAQVLDVDHRVKSYWRGVDVNVTLRAKGGLRLTGGTSTGGQFRDTCNALFDNVGNSIGSGLYVMEEREPACSLDRPMQTNMRGTASYTIPWVDVLFSSTFSYRPGVQQSANVTYNIANDLIWMPGTNYADRIRTDANGNPANKTTLNSANAFNPTSTTYSFNVLSNDTFGEGLRLFDIKLAKNIRFNNKRINFGMDIYNVFNSDGAQGYCTQFPTCTVSGNSGNVTVPWPAVTALVTPRYARFQMQVDF